MKVRITEQEDYVYPENDHSGTWDFLKLIESLCSEEERNKSKSQPSMSKNTKACPSTKGILKNVGEDQNPKENTRASSVIRPRAILSSPDNDELIGSINDLNNKRKKDARGTVGGHAKVFLANQRQSSSKSKVHISNFGK